MKRQFFALIALLLNVCTALDANALDITITGPAAQPVQVTLTKVNPNGIGGSIEFFDSQGRLRLELVAAPNGLGPSKPSYGYLYHSSSGKVFDGLPLTKSNFENIVTLNIDLQCPVTVRFDLKSPGVAVIKEINTTCPTLGVATK